MVRPTLLLSLAATTAAVSFGQNDDCTSAIPLPAGVPTAYDTSTATASLPPWPCAGGGGPDLWYTYTATMAASRVRVEACGSSYDTSLEIFGGTCGSLISVGCNDDGCGLQSTLTVTNLAAGTNYLIRVGGYNGNSGGGTLLLVENTNTATNDECSTAMPIAASTPTPFDTGTATLSPEVWPCAANGGPDLWYVYTSTTPGTQVRAVTCGSNYDTAVEIFSGPCGALASLACNDDACGLQSTATATNPGPGTDFYIRVGGYNGLSGSGSLTVSEVFVPDCLMPDPFEDSDDCNTAAPLGDGNYLGLNVEESDNDYYAVGLDPGATLTVDVFFIDAFADVDVYLWDPNVACDTNVVGQGLGSGALAVGFSASDNEQITHTNTTGGPQSLIVEIDMYTVGGCNDYDLSISGSNGMSGGIGVNYCVANPNSTTGAGTITARGSRLAANNDVELTADGLPNNAFGFFIVSQTQGFVPNPNGSSGNLCLGGAIGRYVGPGQIQNTGGAGAFSLVLDITMTPQPNGFVGVAAGETWNYQAWHRDSGAMGPTSNFTDAIQIDYL